MTFFPHRKAFLRAFSVAAALSAFALTAAAADPDTNPLSPESFTYRTESGLLIELTALADNAVRVRYTPNKAFSKKPEFILTNAKPRAFTDVQQGSGGFKCVIGDLSVQYFPRSGLLFTDAKTAGFSFLESTGAEKFTKSPSRDASADSYQVQTSFTLPRILPETQFGLGQFQDAALNLANQPRQLLQVNTQASVPFLYSTSGYGLLWHNYSRTLFNPADTPIELKKVAEGQGQTVNVTTSVGGRREFRRDSTLTGEFTVDAAGEYAFQLDCGQTMARRHVVSIDGKQIVEQRNTWLPPVVGFKVKLNAGKHTVTVQNEANDRTTLKFRPGTPGLNTTTFRSDDAKEIDYVFISGDAEKVMKTYRELCGKTPMLPKYAFGYWHCRERYVSQDDLLSNLREFRARKIPVDIIVQDWQWWDSGKWNSMHFDSRRFADPKGMNDEVHKLNAHSMLSVWSKASKDNPFAEKMVALDGYIRGTDWIDFTKPEAAKLYWDTIVSDILSTGIDSWWFDATEPENDDLHNRNITLGRGNEYRNVYPLIVNTTAYDRLRQAQPERRALILTRCAFAGQSRQPSVIWSGDVGSNWSDFRTQIISGLGMMMSGIPYWTTDTGGFFRPGDQYRNKEYIERMLRWFEYSTFSPILRVHGYTSQTELWRYGEEAEKVFRKYLDIRYHLLPYVYTAAADAALEGGIIMRPWMADFPGGTLTAQNETEYMLGPSLLVAPVTSQDKTAEVYLPANKKGWYDLWTGKQYKENSVAKVDAPLDRIPVFVKAGAILPWGETMQYVDEKLPETLEIRVYPGADGSYSLYEDNGKDYSYEQGKFTRIKFEWNDAKGELTIGDRKGEYDGMLKDRTFRVCLMNEKNAGADNVAKPDAEVKYSGKKVTVKLSK
jgi:alpha-D-xyloside xylohydrolase